MGEAGRRGDNTEILCVAGLLRDGVWGMGSQGEDTAQWELRVLKHRELQAWEFRVLKHRELQACMTQEEPRNIANRTKIVLQNK